MLRKIVPFIRRADVLDLAPEVEDALVGEFFAPSYQPAMIDAENDAIAARIHRLRESEAEKLDDIRVMEDRIASMKRAVEDIRLVIEAQEAARRVLVRAMPEAAE